MNEFYDLETATDATARRYRALRDAGRALAAQLVDAGELVRRVKREIHRFGPSGERTERLTRAMQRVLDIQAAIDAHHEKCKRYLPEPTEPADAAKVGAKRRSHA